MTMTKRQLMLIPEHQPMLASFPLIVRAISMLIPTSREFQQHLFEPLSKDMAKTYARVESTLSKFYGRSVGMLRIHPGYTKQFPDLQGTVHAFEVIIHNTSKPVAALVMRGGGISLYEAAYTRNVLEEFRRGNGLPFTIKHRLVRNVLHLPTRGINVAKPVRYTTSTGDH